MEKRMLLALSLSFLVIGVYPVIMQKMYPDYYKKNMSSRATNAMKTTAADPAKGKTPVDAKLVKAGSFSMDNDRSFHTDHVALVLNDKDGGIRELAFPKYPDSESGRPIRLFSSKTLGLSSTALVLSHEGQSDLVQDFTLETSGSTVTASALALDGKIQVKKSIVYGEDYSADVSFSFENLTGQPLNFSYELLVGAGITPRHSIDSQYIEANFFSDKDGKKVLKHIKEHRSGKMVRSESVLRWVAVKDRHFSVILLPKEKDSMEGLVRGLGSNELSASLVSAMITLPAQGSLRQDYTLYTGPNEIERLMGLGLEDLINFGIFDWIGKLCVGALEMIHQLVRNYGLSVIALTTLINLLLFPMTRISYMSMKRMQLIQPQMNKLREQHKKNPEKLNKEMMELYKKHKVNPFGGCLPMVLQLPIFMALYVALSKAVNLINAEFLWVKDLSSPDRVYLPVTLPFLGNSIHLLPLLMVGAMVFQQRFTQIKMDNPDPQMQAQQKMMAVMMPIVFGFIFYQMPASLVVYWLTNTLLMTSYQLRLKNMTLA